MKIFRVVILFFFVFCMYSVVAETCSGTSCTFSRDEVTRRALFDETYYNFYVRATAASAQQMCIELTGNSQSVVESYVPYHNFNGNVNDLIPHTCRHSFTLCYQKVWEYFSSSAQWYQLSTSATTKYSIIDSLTCSSGISPLSCKECSDFSVGVCGLLDDECGATLNCTDVCTLQTNISQSALYCNPASPYQIFYNQTNQLPMCSSQTESGECVQEVVPVSINCTGTFVCQPGVAGTPASCQESPTFNYWADLMGRKITASDVICKDDLVKIISSDTDGPYQLINGSGVLFRNVSGTNIWKTEVGHLGVNFSSDDGYSSNLIDVIDATCDSPLVIELITPMCGDIINDDEIRTVTLNVSDPDDIVTGTVSIKGATIDTYPFDNLDGEIVSFDYNFSHAGNAHIIIEANNSRGEYYSRMVMVMVVDDESNTKDPYVASCIDKPINLQTFNSSIVQFDASSSRGLIFHGEEDPKRLEVVPASDLFLDWDFYHNGVLLVVDCKGFGTQDCEGNPTSSTGKSIIQFIRQFDTVNRNSVTLSVSIPDSILSAS